MSSLCNYMDCPEWTPEQRIAIARLELLRMKRNTEEQERAARYYNRHFSKLATSGEITSPSCTDPVVTSTPYPAENQQ
jgi:hypothetical protein